jgi:hypothetical protein
MRITAAARTDEVGAIATYDAVNFHHLHIDDTQITYDEETGMYGHRVYSKKKGEKHSFAWDKQLTALTFSLCYVRAMK